MKKGDFVKALAEFPDDASLELGRFFAFDQKTKEIYETRLDFPIQGVAYDEGGMELVLMVGAPGESKLWLQRFGKVRTFEGPAKERPDLDG